MKNRILAASLCLMMLLSCITIAMAGSSPGSDAIVVDQETGDAWGIGAEIDEDDILELINELLADETGMGMGYTSLEAAVNDILNGLGYQSDLTDIGFSAKVWAIAEVTDKTADGYTVSCDTVASVSLSISGTVSDTDDNGDVDTLKTDGLELSFYVTSDSEILTDSDFAVKNWTSEITVTLGIDGRANIVFTDDEPELVDQMRDIDEKVVMSIDMSMQPNEPITIVPADGKDIDQTVKVRTMVDAVISSTFPIDGSTSHQYRDSDVEEIEWKADVSQAGSFLKIVPEMDESDIPWDIGDRSYYTYPFEAHPDIPASILVGDSLKLDDAGKKTLKDKIAEERRDNDPSSVSEHTVTFMDRDGGILKEIKVADGATAQFPTDYYPYREFSGWLTSDGNLWKEDYKVRSDLTLAPVFAQVVAGDAPGYSDFSESGIAAWILDVDDDAKLRTVIDNDLIANGEVLFVNVFDKDGVLAYQWCLSGNSASEGRIVPLVQATDLPDKQYLKDIAKNGKTLYLDFSASGDMPANTSFKYCVKDLFSDGDDISVYHVNEVAGEAEYTGKAVVKNGYVVMPLQECSSYLLVQDSDSNDGGSNDTMVILAVAIVIVVLVAAVLYMRSKKTGSS